MSQASLVMRSSDLSGTIIISVQDDEGIVARRFLELVVTERWVTHNIEVRHVFNGLRHPEVIEVEDGANVITVVTRVEVDLLTFAKDYIEPVAVFFSNFCMEDVVVVSGNNGRGKASHVVGGAFDWWRVHDSK
jgi:hypothetical protein